MSQLTQNKGEVQVVYDTPHGEVLLTPHIIKKYLVNGDPGKVTDQELGIFMKLCEYQKLNPWLHEAYLIKYGTHPATMVVGWEAFLKRAFRHKKYQGHEVSCEGEPPEMTATGSTHVEGYKVPITVTVEYKEYVGRKGNGEINKQWGTKPKTMLKKVALAQSLRQAFPEDLGGLYTEEESGEGLNNTPPTNAEKLNKKLEQGAEIQESRVNGDYPPGPETQPDSADTPPPAEGFMNYDEKASKDDSIPMKAGGITEVKLSEPQRKKIMALFNKTNVGRDLETGKPDRKLRIAWVKEVINPNIESVNDLTKVEAVKLIDLLEMAE